MSITFTVILCDILIYIHTTEGPQLFNEHKVKKSIRCPDPAYIPTDLPIKTWTSMSSAGSEDNTTMH